MDVGHIMLAGTKHLFKFLTMLFCRKRYLLLCGGQTSCGSGWSSCERRGWDLHTQASVRSSWAQSKEQWAIHSTRSHSLEWCRVHLVEDSVRSKSPKHNTINFAVLHTVITKYFVNCSLETYISTLIEPVYGWNFHKVI